jgi:two-component system alkaline phosphatase synthesis response regulator PhoP
MENSTFKILLVDDEPDILEFLGYNLNKEGYEVHTAEGGKQGLEIAKKIIPDLIILDLMMPEQDGIETCYLIKQIPELKNVKITFLTARNEDYSEISGLEAGADDYITKPIKPRVLVSRVKALLRRSSGSEIENSYPENGFFIDKEKHFIIKDSVQYSLPKKEFELFSLLYSKPGKVFTRDEIMDKVWGNDVIVGDRTIDVHIRKLREKLGSDNFVTIKGVGYKIVM